MKPAECAMGAAVGVAIGAALVSAAAVWLWRRWWT